jgi:hypothetical protein
MNPHFLFPSTSSFPNLREAQQDGRISRVALRRNVSTGNVERYDPSLSDIVRNRH